MSVSSRYSLVRKIADGGMAEIFLARLEGAQGFRKLVVLKRIRTAFYADPQFRDMLLDEAHIAMSLNHGNIVQVLDLGESAGRYFLALELVDGWSLDGLLTRGQHAGMPLPRELALYITLQVCRALAYAHGKRKEDGEPLGIVHRDISPQNILISEQGEVKLADFGIAKALGRREKTAAGVVKGKIYFMSPEQAEAAELDHRSDLFSLGTVLYYLVTQRLPFQAPTPIETMLRIKAAEFPRPELVVPSLETGVTTLIQHAMALKPEDRYATAEEMLTDVERVLRTHYPPAGQTELKRYLKALGEKDHTPPISQTAAAKTVDGEELVSGEWVELGDSSIIPPTLPPRKVPPSALGSGTGSGRGEGGTRAWPALVLALLVLGVGIWQLRPSTNWPPAPQPAPLPGEWVVAKPSSQEPVSPPAEVAAIEDAGMRLAESVGEISPSAPPPADAGHTEVPLNEPADDALEQRLREEAEPNPGQTVIGEAEAAKPPADAGMLEASAPRAPDAGATSVPATPAPSSMASNPPAGSSKSSAPASSRGGTVSVRVKSNPPGAIVKINNRIFGPTPISLRFLPNILYELTFVKSGYVTTSRKLYVQDRPDQSMTAGLRKGPLRTNK